MSYFQVTNTYTSSQHRENIVYVLTSNNNEKYATYKQFAVGDEQSVCKLTIGGYQGDAGEAYSFRCISE